MPPGILWGVDPTRYMIPSGSQEIGLTVAGISACPNTDDMLSLPWTKVQSTDSISVDCAIDRSTSPTFGRSGPDSRLAASARQAVAHPGR
jgi:hypothetical protein